MGSTAAPTILECIRSVLIAELVLSATNFSTLKIDPHWNQTMEQSFRGVMDEFQKYQNTAGFFIGNEILNDGTLITKHWEGSARHF